MKYDAMERYTTAEVSSGGTLRRGLTANVTAGHDDHAENAHGLEEVVGTHDPLEAEAGRVLAGNAGRSADGGLVEVGVEVEELVDLFVRDVRISTLPG